MVDDPVVISPYDRHWPERFERERAQLARALADVAPHIEHVGSTAVPGLAAKPIVDILLGVERLQEVEARISVLEGLGFAYVPEYERELPDRRYFRKPVDPPRDVHLHCVVQGGSFWQRQLAFRDRLRADEAAAAAYQGLKQRLAAEFGADREGYTLAKADFIEGVLAGRGISALVGRT